MSGTVGPRPESIFNRFSLNFDGIDDYVDCSSAISSVSADNEGTFSVWYKPSSLSTNSNIITLTDRSASDVYFIIGWSNPSFLNNVFVVKETWRLKEMYISCTNSSCQN